MLVVAYLLLGQLSAGLRQGDVPLQGASSTWEHQTSQAVPSTTAGALTWSSGLLTASQGKSSAWGRSPFAVVGLTWGPLNNCGWTASLQRLLQLVHCDQMQPKKRIFLRNAPKLPENRLSQMKDSPFPATSEKGYYFDLAIRDVLKFLSTVPVAAEDVYHTGRRESPLATNLMYKCRK